MATRREKVILDLEDNFTAGMARAAAAAQLLDKSLGKLSGSTVTRTRTDMDGMARSADTAGKSIDKLSGRLVLFTRVAAALGPGIAPIGAAAVPALAAMVTQMTLAAGGVGTAVLAFKGMGDALKSLNEYQLEPTAENLQKMRIEMEKLGPDGAHFVRFLDSLGPQLSELQMTARAGLLPGVEEGLTSLLDLAPRANRLVADMAGAMGQLAAEAGEGLAGPEFRDFFEYLERDARPIMLDMGHTIGSFAEGLGDMMVAFEPLTRDFSSGFADMAADFAEWAEGLTASESFQNFLSYVEANGPRVLDLLGSIGNLFSELVQATAPIGEVVVPALTVMADVMATLADSPFGSAFFSYAAAMSAYRLAADGAATASARLQGTFGKMSNFRMIASGVGVAALALTDLDESAGLSNTAMLGLMGTMAGPWGAAVGLAAGAVMDFTTANRELSDAITAANRAADTGNLDLMRTQMRSLKEEIQSLRDAAPDEWWQTLFGLRYTGSTIYAQLTGQMEDAAVAAQELKTAMEQTKFDGGAQALLGPLGLIGDELRGAASAARDFSGALAELSGWFDKREALRGYADAVDKLAESLKKDFSRETAADIDSVGRSIIQVAENIKSQRVRAQFLADARADLLGLARDAGPKARAEIMRVIEALDRFGVTRPKKPRVDVDNKPAKDGIREVGRDLDRWGNERATATADADGKPAQGVFADLFGLGVRYSRSKPQTTVTANGQQAMGVLGSIIGLLSNIRSKTVTVTTHFRQTGSGQGQASSPYYASGGYTGPGGVYEPAGIVHRGEVVIPQRYVKRDWSLLKARYGDLPGFASGGVVPDRGVGTAISAMSGPNYLPWVELRNDMREFGRALREGEKITREEFRRRRAEMQERKEELALRSRLLERELRQAKERLDAERDHLRELKDARKSLVQAVAGNFMSDIFGGNLDLVSLAKEGRLGAGFMGQVLAWIQSSGTQMESGAMLSDYIDDYLASLTPAQIAALQVQGQAGQLAEDTENAQRFAELLQQLADMGLDGAAYQALAASGNIAAAQFYAGMTPEQIAAFEQSFEQRNAAAIGAGQVAGNAEYAQAIRQQTREVIRQRELTADIRQESREANKRLEHFERMADRRLAALEEAIKKDGPKKTGEEVGKAINGTVGKSERSAVG